MKKLFFSIFALIGFAVSATAQTVTVADVEVMPGNKVKAILSLDAPADKYTGAQLELQFPETGFSIEETDAVTGWVGSLQYNIIGSKVKIAAAGSNTFTTASIAVEFSVASDLELAKYDVAVSGVFEGDGFDDAPITPESFYVVVSNYFVLDENSIVEPTPPSSAVNVKVKRTLTKDEWSTICLPFTIKSSDVPKIFGENYVLAEWNGRNVKNGNEIEMKFTKKTGALSNNTPYLIKPSVSVAEFTVDARTIIDGSPKVDKAEKVFDPDEEDYVDRVIGSFIGTYKAETIVPNNCLFIYDNNFYSSNGNTKMKGFRCYFKINDFTNPAAARVKLSVTDDDGNTTNIDPRTMETIENGKVYNMNGQYVGEAEDANSLPKGVYIVNGKKKVIK